MKHIIKVQNLENLPETRPLVAMDGNGNLKWYAGGTPTPQVEFVDMGLPSGILWANMNIGATCQNTKESWIGNYYAWAELEPKNTYTWETYKFHKYTEYEWYSKYADDGLYELEPEDDIAYITYGENCKVPSIFDYRELIENTSQELVTNYQGIIGLTGYIFTAQNGNTLFFPFTGYADNNTVEDLNIVGYYWGNELYDPDTTFTCRFKIDNEEISDSSFTTRYTGQPIRAIQVQN